MSDYRHELEREHVEALYDRARTLEERVAVLERSLEHTQGLLRRLVDHLEHRFGEPIDDEYHLCSRIL